MQNLQESSMDTWIPFLQELVWPITVLLILFVLRKYIPQLMDRTTKIGAMGVELEFEKAKEFSSDWSNEMVGDIRTGVKSDDFSSGVMDLMDQFSKEGSYDYAGIDIYGGNAWLTSRLFIFSTVLSKARGINYWLFVDSHNSIHKKFIGYIDSRSLRLQLTDHFPWLSKAYSEALLEIFPEGEHRLKAADTWQITQLVQQFLKSIQKDYNMGGGPNAIEKDWVLLKDKATLEKARFLDINELRSICGDWILTASIQSLENSSPDRTAEKILLCNESLIPLLESGNRFVDMIDVVHAKRSLIKSGFLGKEGTAKKKPR